jgi:predicted GTPase
VIAAADRPGLGTQSEIQAACARAVRGSEDAADRLRRDVTDLIKALAKASVAPTAATAAELCEADRQLNERIARDLEAAVAGRTAHHGTFNIILFGRTGAGKSSIMSALTRGDCSKISPGVSDHTTEVESRVSRSLQIFDTPGTQGWGRTRDPAALLEETLSAVASADLVLLCFDSKSQRVAEFATVARWIAEYRKPAVAVLNVLNAKWRCPPQVPAPEKRWKASRTVRDHVGTVTRSLAEIGLHGTPVIALSAKDAAFARVPCCYRGHDPEGFAKCRERAGTPERLLEWSNLGVLEALVAEAVGRHALELRNSALYQQVAAAAERADGEYEEAGAQLTELSEQQELGLQRVLAVLGAPENLRAPQDPASERALTAVSRHLSELERLRRSRWPAPARGSALRYADERMTACIGPLRVAALDRAERLIDRALERKRKFSKAAFEAEVFREQEVKDAVARVQEDFTAFLRRQIQQLATDVIADVKCVAGRPVKVRGGRGRALYWAGAATSAVGIGGGLFSATIAGIAIANAWNPFGWGLFALGFTVILSGIALDLLGGWLRKAAAQRRERERGQVRAAARRSVNEAFDQLQADLTAAFAAGARKALVDQLEGITGQAVALRQLIAAQDERRGLLSSFLEGMPAVADPRDLLRESVRACEVADGVPDRPADLWLGESWIDDEAGAEPRSWRRAEPSRGRDDVVARVRDALGAAVVAPGAGRAWLARHRKALSRDPAAAVVVKRLDQLADETAPRIVFCGDYNSGKTALIARLHRAAGLEPPGTLVSGGAATTDEVRAYPWCGYQLTDTPGFQSWDDRHAALAREAAADADVIVYLFTPEGISGDLRDIRAVLGGTRTARILPVLSRVDDLSVNPEDSPRAFAALCIYKEAELWEALRRTVDRSFRWPLAVSLAPAPFDGLVESASWDGVAEFARALTGLHGELSRSAPDGAILGGAIHRLITALEAAEVEAARLRPAMEQAVKLRGEAHGGRAEAQALADERRGALDRIVGDFLEELIERALTARDKDARVAILKRMSEFAADSELAGLTADWERATHGKVRALIHDTNASLARRRAAASFARAARAPGAPDPLDLSELDERGKHVRSIGSFASRGAGALTKLEKLASEGLRFTKFIRSAGPVFTIAGAALSAWDIVDDVRHSAAKARARAEVITALHRAGRAWVRGRCDQEPSLLALAEHQAALASVSEDADADLARNEKELTTLEKQIALYRDAVADAVRTVKGDRP